MRLKLISLVVSLLVGVSAAAGASVADSLLHELDGVIAQKEAFSKRRKDMITESRRNLAKATSDRDRYNISRSLYSHYRSYMGDSARWVAARRLETARKMQDDSRILSAHLNLAESFSLAGDYYQALEILDSLPRSGMERYHRKYLYTVYGITYDRMAKSEGIQSNRLAYEKLEKAYLDSTLSLTSEEDGDYLYLKAAQLNSAGHPAEALQVIAQAASRPDFKESAAMLGQEALAHHALHETDAEIRCLARAAILDLSDGIRDYTALSDLALLLNQRGDSERAYNYIRCALEDARLCNAKSRTHEILELIPVIDAQYHESERDRIRTLWILFAIITLLAVTLAISLRVAWRRVRTIRDVSQRLNRTNRELEESNNRLRESNREKVRFITEVFDAHSGYISRMEVFRTRILALVSSSNYRGIKRIVESEASESSELKELYARFDTIFLRLYPEFLTEYNSLARDACKVAPDAASLTSELRVLALMKIGITRSSRIAELLHYTPQTVYNYKFAIRNSLNLSKEETDTYIATPLG